MKKAILTLIVSITTFYSCAQNVEDKNILQLIEKEGIENSHVMDILSSLVDIHSPRLAGSDGYYNGAEWVKQTMESWDCEVELEPYHFPSKGWTAKSFSIALTAPRFEPIIGYPAAWTGSTNNVVNDTPLLIDFLDIETLKKVEGQLKGRILLYPKADDRLQPQETIISADDINKYNEHEVTEKDLTQSINYVKELLTKSRFDRNREDIMAFLRNEEVAAVIMPSVWDNHIIEVSDISFHHLQNSVAIPWFFISKETYHKIVALIKKKTNPTISLSLHTEFYDRPENNVNVLADIKGADPLLKDEIVIAGAHFDTWHGGGNASDNNAGVATIMEAFRILKSLGIQPRRTIRAGFWGGEEQEFYGSTSYLKKHLGDVLSEKYKPGQSKHIAYYNIDSGGGAIRGFFLQGNEKAKNLVAPWGEAFKKWKLETINSSASHGSDHLIFDAANIPSFDTFQDPSLYWSHQHHTNVDETALINAETMKRNAVIMATFIYKTAMMNYAMPRKQLKN